jgi:hypothetical protein
LAVKNAKAAVWWLSVDNFLLRKNTGKIRDEIRYWKEVRKGLRPWQGVRALKSINKFSQSHYSSEYLLSKGIAATDWFEPINERFLRPEIDAGPYGRRDEILFNPLKGEVITRKLIDRFPEFKFVPLKGFNKEQLTERFQNAKIYIDFGHHPGRDRIPREAAAHGCCILTGMLGSAENSIDIPIANNYKLDSERKDFLINFERIVMSIFSDFTHHYLQFESYRNRIKGEPETFKSQLASYFLAAH